MRNPDRIDPIIDAVHAFWRLNPDMRLSQIISAAVMSAGWQSRDTWNAEDDLIIKGLENIMRLQS